MASYTYSDQSSSPVDRIRRKIFDTGDNGVLSQQTCHFSDQEITTTFNEQQGGEDTKIWLASSDLLRSLCVRFLHQTDGVSAEDVGPVKTKFSIDVGVMRQLASDYEKRAMELGNDRPNSLIIALGTQ
jgi:hypothetical protein